MDFWTGVLTFVLGAASTFALRLLPPVFSEGWRLLQARAAARRVINQQLDPLLKAADELQGKLRSLAEEDFQEFRRLPEEKLTTAQLVDPGRCHLA